MSGKANLKDLLSDDSFVRWLREDASDEEALYWKSWSLNNVENFELVEDAKDLLHMSQLDDFSSIPNPHAELAKLEAAIDDFEHESHHSLLNWYKSNMLYGAIAAGLLILVGCVYLLASQMTQFTNNSGKAVAGTQQDIHTNYGEKISIKLSDGSKIVLNANSDLRYLSSSQLPRKIDVWLKGEAYFDIPHLKNANKRVFNVHTPDGTIVDLGTRFAVKTSVQGTRAVLAKGEIKVVVNGSNGKKATTERVLSPGDKANFISGKPKVEIVHVNPQVYTSWIDNKLIFDNTPFKEVAQRVENTYGVKVIVKDPKVRAMNLSGSIKSTNLEILEKALEKILHEPVTQRGKTVYIGYAKN